ncbi:MAG: 4Fe-4S dicluster domain-containing protein [Lentisphaeria bacterium]|nr:4Fe-4S dicluster domain-containing protein [Lentisphaeria bacterium]
MKRLKIVAAQCTGCESCVLSCGFEHDRAFSLHRSRIQIDRDEEHADFTPRVCIQCDERSCVAACPVDALSINETTGAIRVDEGLCIGCRACEAACQHGGIHFIEDVKAPLICDLCGGDPQCIQVCRLPQAIVFVDEGESESPS